MLWSFLLWLTERNLFLLFNRSWQYDWLLNTSAWLFKLNHRLVPGICWTIVQIFKVYMHTRLPIINSLPTVRTCGGPIRWTWWVLSVEPVVRCRSTHWIPIAVHLTVQPSHCTSKNLSQQLAKAKTASGMGWPEHALIHTDHFLHQCVCCFLCNT